MAGRGTPPKDPNRRARRNKDTVALRVITAEPMKQPALPTFDVELKIDGEVVLRSFSWPDRTREWWQMWSESPLSADYTQTDWEFLLDTALLHARYWRGDLSVASELRLRVAKFGMTPEDRARLRITFAAADEAEGKGKGSQGAGSARARRGPLKAAPEAAPEEPDADTA